MIELDETKYENDARTSTAVINGKKIKTPFFMPVSTKAAARHLTTKDLSECGVKATIANSMLLTLNPGGDFIKDIGGLHEFMGFGNIIFTDSGGFQVMRPFFKKITNNEIEFYSPYNNTVHKISPESSMENQIKIGGDIAMALDHMPLANAAKEEVIQSMLRTFEWAKIEKKKHDELKKELKSPQNLFGIIQGGYDIGLRKDAVAQITSLGFDGYALGGLAIGEPRPLMFKVFEDIIPLMPKDKLRYIMGLGHPIDILKAVEHGADCFDSVYPTQIARHNHILTKKGVIKITHTKYRLDKTKLDENCDCYVCRNFSKAYIRYLTKVDEPVAYQLKSYHNIYFMQKFMEDIQDAIAHGAFQKLKKQYDRYYAKEDVKDDEENLRIE